MRRRDPISVYAIPWLLVGVVIGPGLMFNVDTEFPILLSVGNFYDGNQTFFGSNIVLLEAALGRGENSSTGWVLIGAPKANFSSHSNYTEIIEPGVVWRCSLGRRDNNHCEIVVLDTFGNYDPLDPNYKVRDVKDGGGLGGSLHIGDSDRFVACASRWANNKFSYQRQIRTQMNGMCYWLPKSHLQAEQTNETWPWPGGFSDRLMPFLRPVLYKNKVTAGEKTNDTVLWDDGLAGFSVHVTKGNDMLLGSPGVDSFKGTIVEYVPARKDALYFKPIEDPNFPDDVMYFGYALASGKFISDNSSTIQFAAGAPRGGFLTGRVYIFTLLEPSSLNVGTHDMNIMVELKAENATDEETFGSYFGAVLAAADLNGDGLDDLLVGAPLFSFAQYAVDGEEDSKQRQFETPEGEEGCVFVYYSDGVSASGRQEWATSNFSNPPLQLHGDMDSGSRFGQAMGVLGDITGDGIADVAIGAPFENFSKGAVYIYHGSVNGLVFAQKLQASSVSDSLRGFGFSISRGVDIDNNEHPDIGVGSYLSNDVVIFRTIPVVTSAGSVRFPSGTLWADLQEFNISSCISYEGKHLKSHLPYNVTFKLDSFGSHGPLIHWKDQAYLGDLEIFEINETTIKFRGNFSRSESCYNFTVVKLREPQSSDDDSFSVHQEYILEKNPPPEGVKRISYRINKAEIPSIKPVVDFTESEADFYDFEEKLPLASTPGVMHVNSSFPTSKLCHIGGEHACRPNITAFAALTSDGAKINVSNPYLVGSSEQTVLQLMLVNKGEVATLPLLVYVNWTAELRATKADKPHFIHERGITCNLGKPLLHGESENITIVMDSTELYDGEFGKEILFVINVTSSSLTNTVKYSLPVAYQYSVEYDVPAADEAELAVSGGTQQFRHEYKISISGPSPLHALQLDFQIPFALNTTHGLFKFIELKSYHGRYLADQDYNVRCDMIQESKLLVDSARNLKEDEQHLFTHFRWSQIFPWALSEEEKADQFKRIHCDRADVVCAHIICAPMKHFTARHFATYALNMELLLPNLKIFEDFTTLMIETESRAIALDNQNGSKMVDNTLGIYRTEFRVAPSQGIPAWMIVAGVPGGLVLFILTALVLAKCGFFRRQKRDKIRKFHGMSE